MSRYTSVTPDDRAEMLAAIGVESTADLFEQIPAELRLGRPLELPEGMSEAEVYERLAALAARNADCEEQVCFLGAGMYDHYVPAIVDAITQRSEFLTPYTPYQPEISQGGLQAMFEFQTMMSELTGLPVSNASVYEGPSAVAAAGWLARLHNQRPRPPRQQTCSRRKMHLLWPKRRPRKQRRRLTNHPTQQQPHRRRPANQFRPAAVGEVSNKTTVRFGGCRA